MTFSRIGMTSQNLNQQNRSEDGGQRGETGSIALHGDTSKIAAWLSNHRPADTDEAALSRMSSRGVGLTVKYEGRYPSGPNGERLPSYQVAVGCEFHGEGGDIQAALDDLRNFMTPAPIRNIEAWIAELSVLTAGRGREGLDAEILVSAYASRLSRYPADVARHVLIGKSWKWFPAWDELERLCEAMTSPRRQMIAALERGPSPKEQARPAPTQEERDRIAALVAEKFPQVSQAWRDAAVDEMMKPDHLRRFEAGK